MKTLKRIQEYEKFEANCQMIKELEKDRRTNVSKNVLDRRNTIMVDEAKNTQEKRSSFKRAQSISNPTYLSPKQEPQHRESFSLYG